MEINKVSDSYKNHLLAFIGGPILKAIEAFFDLLIPLVMKSVIDLNKYRDVDRITNPLTNFVARLVRLISFPSLEQTISDSLSGGIIILLMSFIGFAFTMTTQYIAAVTSVKVGSEIRDAIFSKVINFSSKDKAKYGSSKLITILNADTYQVQQGVLHFIRLIVRSPMIIVGSIIFAMILDFNTGLVFLAITPLILVVIFFIMRQAAKQYLGIQERLDSISNSTSQAIEGSKDIRAFVSENKENESYKKETEAYEKAAIRVNKLNSLINPATFLIISAATLIIVLINGLPIANGVIKDAIMQASTTITEITYLATILFTLVQLTNVVLIFTKSAVSTKRIDSLLSINPEIVENPDGEVLSINKDEEIFSFDNVSLSYEEGGNCALNNISFSLLKGQTLGVIGGTGSGKTSLVNLMLRFINPINGNIKYKGIDVKNYKLSALRREIGLVPQKSTLFKGTIRSNLSLGKKDATEEEIKEALIRSCAFDFVQKYDDGFNHEVEEGGMNFSGGQRQRLCIARALITNPEILVLDDSTSALDMLTDKTIRSNLKKDYKGLTKVIISQRVSTIMDADLILVMDGGNLVGKGSHKELLKSCLVYKEIFESQNMKGGALWVIKKDSWNTFSLIKEE